MTYDIVIERRNHNEPGFENTLLGIDYLSFQASDNILMIKSLHSCLIFDNDFNTFIEDSMVA
jgi:hypothetical protein